MSEGLEWPGRDRFSQGELRNSVLYQSAAYIHACLHEHAFLIITEMLLYKATSGHRETQIQDTEGFNLSLWAQDIPR